LSITDEELLRLALDARAEYLDELGRPEEARALRDERVEPSRPRNSKKRVLSKKLIHRKHTNVSATTHQQHGGMWANLRTHVVEPDSTWVTVHLESGEDVTLGSDVLDREAVERLYRRAEDVIESDLRT